MYFATRSCLGVTERKHSSKILYVEVLCNLEMVWSMQTTATTQTKCQQHSFIIMLPPEIIDHIFSFLHSDLVTLETCSRAHPIFLKLVQKHLYVNTTIRNDTAEIVRLSKSVSDIAHYVRSLHIMIERPRPLQGGSLNDEGIAMILPQFRMLRKISLDDCVPTRWPMSHRTSTWPKLHERFRAAFIQCLHLSSLIEVSIHGTREFPLTAFANCMSIKKLSLDGTFTFNNLSADSTSPYPQIESLSIRRCRASLPTITSWAKTCNPRSLGFSLPNLQNNSELQPLLQVWSNTLTSLELDFGITRLFHYNHHLNYS